MGMSMTVTLSELDVLREFDQRVAKGVIFYDNEPKIQVQEVDGYKVGSHVNGETPIPETRELLSLTLYIV